MGSGDAHALLGALLADDGQAHGLAAVVVVDLVAGLVLLGRVEGDKAGLLGGLHRPGDGLPLGLGGVHKGLVALGELAGLFQLLGAHLGRAVGAVVQELLRQLLGVDFFIFLGHWSVTSYSS